MTHEGRRWYVPVQVWCNIRSAFDMWCRRQPHARPSFTPAHQNRVTGPSSSSSWQYPQREQSLITNVMTRVQRSWAHQSRVFHHFRLACANTHRSSFLETLSGQDAVLCLELGKTGCKLAQSQPMGKIVLSLGGIVHVNQ